MLMGETRNVVTYHAEDGSGVGAAVIAGRFLLFIPEFDPDPSLAMTKLRKEQKSQRHNDAPPTES